MSDVVQQKRRILARADIRGHDLRRTAASFIARGGVPRLVISRIRNHSEENDITSVYDRYSYDAEKRRAARTLLLIAAKNPRVLLDVA